MRNVRREKELYSSTSISIYLYIYEEKDHTRGKLVYPEKKRKKNHSFLSLSNTLAPSFGKMLTSRLIPEKRKGTHITSTKETEEKMTQEEDDEKIQPD